MLPDFAFASPLLLGFLAALPLLWWLLRLTPPTPRKIVFPALALLRDIVPTEQTPARTPWWLLLLRLVAAALLIFAFAQPLMNPAPMAPGKGALLIAVDNDWAAARDWESRQSILRDLVRQAARESRAVILLPTAPAADGSPPGAIGPLAAEAAEAAVMRLTPQPWPSAWPQAVAALDTIDRAQIGDLLWVASGLGGPEATAFYDALQHDGSARILAGTTPIYMMTPPQNDGDDATVAILRAAADAPAAVTVDAVARDGNVLARLPVAFTAGAPRATAKLDLPLAVRNQLARLEIEGQRTAAATVLLDSGWDHRAVGLAGDKTELDRHSLLSGLFYIDRALKPYADLHVDAVDALLKQDNAVIVLPDTAILNDADIPALTDWVRRGGVLVRFAGDHLAASLNPKETDLLPVSLRTGDRAMGGALSWATPQKLQTFPATSPFHGLPVPDDVTVNRQVLAEPEAGLAAHTWAALADGTPLVTAKPVGQGLSILFHVPARSDWSNLPLSGLFVAMLRRVTDLSRGGMTTRDTDFAALPPLQVLDGFGAEQKPGAAVEPLTNGGDSGDAPLEAGPHHPPGLYGSPSYSRAFNLSQNTKPPTALTGVILSDLKAESSTTDLQPPLLAAAFLLLLGDFLVGLRLRGLLALPRRRTVAALGLVAAILTAPSAWATDEKTAVELTSQTYLAHVRTGDPATDRVADAGLTALADTLRQRTAMNRVGVAEVDPNADDLAFFPLLYWPLVGGEAPLSPAGVARVNDYLHHGGMILFDAMAGEDMAPSVMQRILAGIDLPPLVPLPDQHVLKHSFYLLDDFPGRYDNGHLWLEPDNLSSYDGVATVLYGSNGWAAAWARDANGQPLFPCIPGGEAQREHAFRFGVNLAMMALTGNYKSDQLHTQALLERLGK